MSDFKLLLALAYQGGRFSGNQLQPGNQLTVQSALLQAFHQIGLSPSNGKFAGRTDAGTHARWQLFQTWLPSSRYTMSSLVRRLNAVLPTDITVWDAIQVPDAQFDVRASVHRRWYRYRVQFDPQPNCWIPSDTCPMRLPAPDTAQLQQCAADLIGAYDFKAYQNTDTMVQNTWCRIEHAQWRRVATPTSVNVWQLDIIGNRFLYKMVRNLVADHIAVAQGKLPYTQWRQRLQTGQLRQSGQGTAPACGLTLMRVYYLPCFEYFVNHTVVLQLEQELNALEFKDENLFCQAAGN